MSKDGTNTQRGSVEPFQNSATGASNQMMQGMGMGVSTQSTPRGLESQSVSGCYRADCRGQSGMGG
uniref:Uncharacterized protein n=1 Tax=Panthera leo TaxID=9689 RepID=A0A8C8XWR1_PANLE